MQNDTLKPEWSAPVLYNIVSVSRFTQNNPGVGDDGGSGTNAGTAS